MSIITELRRRHVFRTALAYLIAAVLLVHVADLVVSWFLLPDWISKTVAVVAMLGFPFALVFAWAYEITPEGLKHESEVDPNREVVAFTGRKIDYFTLAALFLLLALSWKDDLANWLAARGEAAVAGIEHAETVSNDDPDYQAFKRQVRAMGLDKHWRENGFPPQCHAVGDDDFDCE